MAPGLRTTLYQLMRKIREPFIIKVARLEIADNASNSTKTAYYIWHCEGLWNFKVISGMVVLGYVGGAGIASIALMFACPICGSMQCKGSFPSDQRLTAPYQRGMTAPYQKVITI